MIDCFAVIGQCYYLTIHAPIFNLKILLIGKSVPVWLLAETEYLYQVNRKLFLNPLWLSLVGNDMVNIF